MTGILGGGSNAKQQTAIGSLQFQTSQKGGAIPLVYGTTRVAGNLLDYQDFTATPVSSGIKGKGGGAGKGTQEYDYSASIVMGLCQGPILGWGLVWYDRSVNNFLALPGLSTVNAGNDGQAPDPYWVANHPANAIGYSGTANWTADNYQLGMSAQLPNFSVEVLGLESTSGVNGYDANPAAIVIDFLTNPRYGAGFPIANLDTGGSLVSYSEYCAAAGIFLSPVVDQQQEAQQYLANIAQLTNSAIVWSGGLLKIIPYGDEPLAIDYTFATVAGDITVGGGDIIELIFSNSGIAGSPVTAQYVTLTTDTAESAAAGLAAAVTNALGPAWGIVGGAAVNGVLIMNRGPVAGTSIAAVASGLLSVALGSTASAGWTPVTTPFYQLGEDDFIVQELTVGVYPGVTPGGPALRMGATPITGGFTDDPVHVVRSSPADADNMIQLETLDRANSYNTTIVETFDQGSIDLFGVRRNTSVKGRAIVDPSGTGQIVAQLLLQRALFYRNTYSFQLGWKYCLLEPMDLVQISDARLGLSNLTVRITSITEDDEGTLSIAAEDFFGTPGAIVYPPPTPINVPGVSSLGSGAGTASVNPTQTTTGTASNYAAAASPVNTPFILEPTGQLLAAQGLSSPQLIVGLSGGPNGGYDPNWGGAQVYASLDDASFGLQGQFQGRSAMGMSTADLPALGGTLSVDLTESHGSLASVSAQAAAQGVSLCAIRTPGGQLEFLSFTTATLTAPYTYDLTGLNRGLYGTFAIDQPAGAQFLFLGAGSYYVQTLPTQYVGQALWFKFPSFNITGGGLQPLSSAAAYEYTPQGAQVNPAGFPLIVIRDIAAPFEVRSSTVRRDAIAPIETR